MKVSAKKKDDCLGGYMPLPCAWWAMTKAATTIEHNNGHAGEPLHAGRKNLHSKESHEG